MVFKNVLIIDNEAVEATALAKAFEARRLPTFVYATGLEALRAVRNMKLGLVIGSITLPGENILEIFRVLKTFPGNTELPFVLILPKGAEYSPEEVLSYGIVDAILRPVNVQEAVRRALEHLDMADAPQGGDSPVDRAVKTALSEPQGRVVASEVKDLGKAGSPQLNLLEDIPDELETEEETGSRPDTESRPGSPRFHRAGQVFDDPVDKLNADLKRSIQSARRNRLIIVGVSALFFGGLASLLFLGGDGQKADRPPVDVQEPVSVPGSLGDSVPPESASPPEGNEDPFGEILKQDLARRKGTDTAAVPSRGDGKTGRAGALFSIQVGAYASEANARKILVDLLEKGYEARMVPQRTSSGRTLHRVLVGGFPDRETAGEALLGLAGKENLEGFITRYER